MYSESNSYYSRYNIFARCEEILNSSENFNFIGELIRNFLREPGTLLSCNEGSRNLMRFLCRQWESFVTIMSLGLSIVTGIVVSFFCSCSHVTPHRQRFALIYLLPLGPFSLRPRIIVSSFGHLRSELSKYCCNVQLICGKI